MHPRSREAASVRIGRYLVHPPIARGGMATVHPAHLVGEGGFTRLVAVKRLHPALAADADVVAMFHDEARIASQIHHPGVVPVLDVVVRDREVILVQEYVHGVPLGVLLMRALTANEPIGVPLCIAATAGLLTALHATHEARDERGRSLDVIHRDVSAQNVMITVDGAVRLLDFGIAKARSSAHQTRVGVFKGKLVYMAPEVLRSEKVTRRADVYAVGVILWQLLVNRRFYSRPDEYAFVRAVTHAPPPSMREALRDARRFVSDARRQQIARLEPIVRRALASDPAERYATAASMLDALLAAYRPASAAELAAWVRTAGAEHLAVRRAALAASEAAARSCSRIVAARAIDPSDAETLVVRPEGARALVALTTPPPVSASIVPCPPADGASPEEVRRTRTARLVPLLPWVGIAMSLLFLGVLAGVAKDAPGDRARSAVVPPAAAVPPPSASIAPPPALVPPLASSAPSTEPPRTNQRRGKSSSPFL